MNPKFWAAVRAFVPPIIVSGWRKFRQKLSKSRRLSSGVKYYRGQGIGGKWEEIGRLQFNFIIKNGLRPEDKFLDIGCGSLRGGIHFVKYLNQGNYCGIDREKHFLEAAREVELPNRQLEYKAPRLLCRNDFDFSKFGLEFDWALAQSVFSHLPWNSILRCLINLEKVLKKGGRFYATFFEDDRTGNQLTPLKHRPGGVVTYFDQDPFHYKFQVFLELAAKVSLRVENLGDWNHPRNQKMLVFRK